MRRNTIACLAMTGALAVLGCGDDETAATPVDGVTITGVITQAAVGNPLVDVQICVVQPNLGCVATIDDGSYSFANVPKNQDVRVTATKSGFVKALGVFAIGDSDVTADAQLFDEGLVASVYGDAGIPLDITGKGAVGIALGDIDESSGHGASGYTATISPSGDGPYYVTGTAIDSGATETSDTGGVAFINLDPGDYEVSVSGPGSCQTELVKTSGSNKWPVPVEAGYISYVITACPDGPGGDGSGGAGGSSSGSGGAGGN